jgi:hypothetical protein
MSMGRAATRLHDNGSRAIALVLLAQPARVRLMHASLKCVCVQGPGGRRRQAARRQALVKAARAACCASGGSIAFTRAALRGVQPRGDAGLASMPDRHGERAVTTEGRCCLACRWWRLPPRLRPLFVGDALSGPSLLLANTQCNATCSLNIGDTFHCCPCVRVCGVSHHLPLACTCTLRLLLPRTWLPHVTLIDHYRLPTTAGAQPLHSGGGR